MIIGQTVFYRLTYSQSEKVNGWRVAGKNFLDSAGDESPVGFVIHVGEPVRGGELLPAVVVRAYNAVERPHIDPDFGAPEQACKNVFSGVADLRVLLPGNDILWVPDAHLDMECMAHTGRGIGATMLPKMGKFTTTAPAELV